MGIMHRYKHVSELMRHTITTQNLTQMQMARKMGWSSSQYINNILRGDCSIPPKKFKRFAKIANITIAVVIDAYLNDQRMHFERINRITPPRKEVVHDGQFDNALE